MRVAIEETLVLALFHCATLMLIGCLLVQLFADTLAPEHILPTQGEAMEED